MSFGHTNRRADSVGVVGGSSKCIRGVKYIEFIELALKKAVVYTKPCIPGIYG